MNRLVLLNGPSGAGKSTTGVKCIEALSRLNIPAARIGIDDLRAALPPQVRRYRMSDTPAHPDILNHRRDAGRVGLMIARAAFDKGEI